MNAFILPCIGILMTCLLAKASARNFSMPCEMAKELYWRDMSSKAKLPNWVCIIQHGSCGRTNTVKSNQYGLFQIPSPEWCRKGKKGGRCKMKCEDLLDDNIDDDVACAKKIYRSLNCYAPWQVWKKKCRGKELPDLSKCC